MKRTRKQESNEQIVSNAGELIGNTLKLFFENSTDQMELEAMLKSGAEMQVKAHVTDCGTFTITIETALPNFNNKPSN